MLPLAGRRRDFDLLLRPLHLLPAGGVRLAHAQQGVQPINVLLGEARPRLHLRRDRFDAELPRPVLLPAAVAGVALPVAVSRSGPRRGEDALPRLRPHAGPPDHRRHYPHPSPRRHQRVAAREEFAGVPLRCTNSRPCRRSRCVYPHGGLMSIPLHGAQRERFFVRGLWWTRCGCRRR
ncbi:unnamed protein product [Ectocarpus sp. 12 AP-2014]